MKIINLRAENVKRLSAVDITPQSAVVEITGANGAGKSSVLDAIFWALAGTRAHQDMPVRRGETEATIALDMGDIKVRREFAVRDDGETTTRLHVESADGARYPSPQKMLDALVGSLTFDPLEFSRMAPKEQGRVLRGFVSGVDFGAEEAAYKADYQARTAANRAAKEARVRMEGITLPEVEGDPPDIASIVEALEEARAWNVRQMASGKRIEETKSEVALYRKRVHELMESLADANAKLSAAEATLMALPNAEQERDESALAAELRDAEQLQRLHAARKTAEMRRDDQRRIMEAEEAKSKALSESIRERSERVRATIAAADMPVPGLQIVESGEAYLYDVPLDQASGAEQLRLSCAIAMASNAELRVIRVRDGSLLDEASMDILREMATDRDYQVWIERVDTSGKVGIVIEDGAVAVDDGAQPDMFGEAEGK